MLNLQVLWESDTVIIIHTLLAIVAIILGTLQLILRKGTLFHRWNGRIWTSSMALVAISSFWIHEFRMFGPFSLIHLLSLLVLYSLWEGLHAIRKGDVKRHRTSMIQLYVMALLITGAFTLLPGRRMYAVIFGA